jgi:hypothetical protein
MTVDCLVKMQCGERSFPCEPFAKSSDFYLQLQVMLDTVVRKLNSVHSLVHSVVCVIFSTIANLKSTPITVLCGK